MMTVVSQWNEWKNWRECGSVWLVEEKPEVDSRDDGKHTGMNYLLEEMI